MNVKKSIKMLPFRAILSSFVRIFSLMQILLATLFLFVNSVACHQKLFLPLFIDTSLKVAYYNHLELTLCWHFLSFAAKSKYTLN